MKRNQRRVSVGPRTVKTAVAVILSMLVAELLGATESKMIFAMLGAMAAVEPTFTDSVESSLTQIVGVIFGAVIGLLMQLISIPPLVACGIGIVIVITAYNALRLRFSPGLPCLIVVMLCIGAEERPVIYALERICSTAIGLFVGMAINMLVMPYDNSRQIRKTARSLDKELRSFLENTFDGDDILPDAEIVTRMISDMDRQLTVFAKQKLLWRLRRQQEELSRFRVFENKAHTLVAHMKVLSQMEKPGRLSNRNRELLEAIGANIKDTRAIDIETREDIVTNYHVSQILRLRSELMEILRK